MGLSSDLISQFVKITQDKQETKKETTAYGKIIKQGDKAYVQLDGSDLLTPITTTTVVKDDDRVLVTIKDHTAIVTGNITNPSASDGDVQTVKEEVTEIGNKISEFEIVIADKVTTEQLEAEIAKIDKLIADEIDAVNGKFETIEVKVADIDTIKADIVEVNQKITAHEGEFTTIRGEIADFKNATIEDLDAISGEFRDLSSDYASFKQTTTNTLVANEASITELETKKLDTETAEIKFANIDFSNIGEAAIENLFSDSGIIKDLIMSDGKVTGELVGVTIKGDLIEGNTLKADKLVILGEDGLYYKLNVNALGETTASSDKKYQNGLDGSVIIAKSITAEKVAVDDLVAFGATIGGYHIDTHSLYSGTKNSIDNTTRGVYLGDDGQFAVGDSNNFLKFFKDTDGSYKLEIKASSIKFGASGETVEEVIQDLIVSTEVEYYLSDSTTSLSGGTWQSTAPAWVDGKYMWSRTKITRKSGTIEYKPSENGTCIAGATGASGEGKGIETTVITYQASVSGTNIPTGEWLSSIPDVPDGYYLWTRTVITYTDETTSIGYSVGKMGSDGIDGQDGADGTPGADGKPGVDGVGIQSTEITYQASNSGTTIPTGEWSSIIPSTTADKPYLWTRTVITYTDETTSTAYAVGATPEGIVIGGRNLFLNSGDLEKAEPGLLGDVTGTIEFGSDTGTPSNNYAAFNYLALNGLDLAGILFKAESYEVNLEKVAKEGDSITVSIWQKFSRDTDNNMEVQCPFLENIVYQIQPKLNSIWQRIVITGTYTKTVSASSPYDTLSVYYGSIYQEGDILYVSSPKIELGNKATDWTPAPEDIDSNIEDTRNDLSTSIDAVNDNLENTVNDFDNKLDEAITTIQTTMETQFSQTNESFEMTFAEIIETITNIDGTVNENYAELVKYIRFVDGTIILGEADNPLQLVLSNDRMSFLQNGEEIAYISDNKLYIYDGEFLNSLTLGRWAFIIEQDGGLSLNYI